MDSTYGAALPIHVLGYNVPIKQDKNFEKLNEPDIIKNSKLSGKKVHKNG